MNKQQVGVALVLQELKCPIEMNSFDSRLQLQKIIYLAQALNINLGYFFSWYLRGPYCSVLVSDGFAINNEIQLDKSILSLWQLGDSLKDKLIPLRSIIDNHKSNLSKYLELLASVHFLVTRNRIEENSIKRILEKYKKDFARDFSDEEIQQGLKELRDIKCI